MRNRAIRLGCEGLLQQAFRLRKSKEFQKTYQKGRVLSGKYLVLYYLNSGRIVTRVGFTVSKKIGKATERNRVKRLMREAYRRNIDSLSQGYDLIFIAKVKIKGIGYELVEKQLLSLCRQAGLLHDDRGMTGE